MLLLWWLPSAFVWSLLRQVAISTFAIWFSIGITYPISLLLFPVAFLLCFYPVSKLFKCAVCAKVQKCFCFFCDKHKARNKRAVRFQQQPVYSTHVVPTFPESTRVSPPSSTYFQVPYTNNFTHITTENAPLLRDERTDTGYGSIFQPWNESIRSHACRYQKLFAVVSVVDSSCNCVTVYTFILQDLLWSTIKFNVDLSYWYYCD